MSQALVCRLPLDLKSEISNQELIASRRIRFTAVEAIYTTLSAGSLSFSQNTPGPAGKHRRCIFTTDYHSLFLYRSHGNYGLHEQGRLFDGWDDE